MYYYHNMWTSTLGARMSESIQCRQNIGMRRMNIYLSHTRTAQVLYLAYYLICFVWLRVWMSNDDDISILIDWKCVHHSIRVLYSYNTNMHPIRCIRHVCDVRDQTCYIEWLWRSSIHNNTKHQIDNNILNHQGEGANVKRTSILIGGTCVAIVPPSSKYCIIWLSIFVICVRLMSKIHLCTHIEDTYSTSDTYSL